MIMSIPIEAIRIIPIKVALTEVSIVTKAKTTPRIKPNRILQTILTPTKLWKSFLFLPTSKGHGKPVTLTLLKT